MKRIVSSYRFVSPSAKVFVITRHFNPSIHVTNVPFFRRQLYSERFATLQPPHEERNAVVAFMHEDICAAVSDSLRDKEVEHLIIVKSQEVVAVDLWQLMTHAKDALHMPVLVYASRSCDEAFFSPLVRDDFN